MASVDKRPTGMWRARWREYPGGPQKAKHFDRKIDAQRFLTGIEHSQLTGSYVDPAAGRITFQTYTEAWRAVQVHRHSTAINAEYQFRLHVYPVIGDRPIAAIRPTEIKGLVKHLRTVLSPSTVVVVFGRVVAVSRRPWLTGSSGAHHVKASAWAGRKRRHRTRC